MFSVLLEKVLEKPALGPTVVCSHEGDVVEIVLHVLRLSVQHGDGGDAPVHRIDFQPIGRVVQLGVPVVDQSGRTE